LVAACNTFAGPGTTAAQTAACNAVLACARRTNCAAVSTNDCLCGTADLSACQAGTSFLGACVAEIKAGLPGVPDTATFNNAPTTASPPRGPVWPPRCRKKSV